MCVLPPRRVWASVDDLGLSWSRIVLGPRELCPGSRPGCSGVRAVIKGGPFPCILPISGHSGQGPWSIILNAEAFTQVTRVGHRVQGFRVGPCNCTVSSTP